MTGVILPVDAGATAAVGLGEWTRRAAWYEDANSLSQEFPYNRSYGNDMYEIVERPIHRIDISMRDQMAESWGWFEGLGFYEFGSF